MERRVVRMGIAPWLFAAVGLISCEECRRCNNETQKPCLICIPGDTCAGGLTCVDGLCQGCTGPNASCGEGLDCVAGRCSCGVVKVGRCQACQQQADCHSGLACVVLDPSSPAGVCTPGCEAGCDPYLCIASRNVCDCQLPDGGLPSDAGATQPAARCQP